jgi:hypothetical protein
MLRHPRSSWRGGSAAAEFAVVLPVLTVLLIGLVVAALGAFRYQAVAWLAREGARLASVRGDQLQLEGKGTAATLADLYNPPFAYFLNDTDYPPKQINVRNDLGLDPDPSKLTYSVSWDDPNGSKMPLYYDFSSNRWKRNNVRVTVTYQWIPEVPFFSAPPLTSTSVMPVTY